jgi:hypothetical protein
MGSHCRARIDAVCVVGNPDIGGWGAICESGWAANSESGGCLGNHHLWGLWPCGPSLRCHNRRPGLHIRHFYYHRQWIRCAGRAVYTHHERNGLLWTILLGRIFQRRRRSYDGKPRRILCRNFWHRAYCVRQWHHRRERSRIHLLLFVEFLSQWPWATNHHFRNHRLHFGNG